MLPYIEVFSLKIPSYGIMMAIGTLLGILLAYKSAKHRKLKSTDVLYAAIYALIGGLIGAKLLYLIVELPSIIADPSILLSMITGGAVFYGGLIGGIVGVILYARKYKIDYLLFFDVMLPAVTLAQAFGRIGCFLAGCCYGMEYNCAVSVVYPSGGIAPGGVPLLPTQLFESAFLFIATVMLIWRLKKDTRIGSTAGWYFMLYGVWRFVIEFFRNDPRGSVGFLSTSQFISLFLIPIGLYLLLRKKRPFNQNFRSE